MNEWAETRIRDYVPNIDDQLVKTLLCSEGRITPADLQAKSATQIRHVMFAALKQARFNSLAI